MLCPWLCVTELKGITPEQVFNPDQPASGQCFTHAKPAVVTWQSAASDQSTWDFSQHHLRPTKSCKVKGCHRPGLLMENWGTGNFWSKRSVCSGAVFSSRRMQPSGFSLFWSGFIFMTMELKAALWRFKAQLSLSGIYRKKAFFFFLPSFTTNTDFWQDTISADLPCHPGGFNNPFLTLVPVFLEDLFFWPGLNYPNTYIKSNFGSPIPQYWSQRDSSTCHGFIWGYPEWSLLLHLFSGVILLSF